MKAQEHEKIPLDAKLLSEAIIELNISRRSVGLYPPEHPITRQAIERAFTLLKKLFDLRSSIILGVAKNELMIDEYTLDIKNPVYREFALALHSKGIAAITFYSGLEKNELLELHLLITEKDLPVGKELVEHPRFKSLRHVRVVPIDLSKLSFVEGVKEKPPGSGQEVWEEYVYGVLEGKLAEDGADSSIFQIPPDSFAAILNTYTAEKKEESYDRVITTYLRKRDHQELNRESLNRFMTLVENLNQNVKEDLLSRTFKHPAMSQDNAGELMAQLTPEDIERMFNIVKNQSSMPKSMRNLLEKLSAGRTKDEITRDSFEATPFVDDIEINEGMMKLFDDDQFEEFVSTDYKYDLETMVTTQKVSGHRLTHEMETALRQESIESSFFTVLLELIGFEKISQDNYLQLLTRLSEFTEACLETGKFAEVLKIHNTLYTHMLEGSYKTETQSMLEYFFHSEAFITKLLDSFKIWGRHQRDDALKLARIMGSSLISPVLDDLCKEDNSSQRSFYISILKRLGKDVLVEAVRRLNDKRWYVVRNMLYLIRECRGSEYLHKIRSFTKHKNNKICLEALRTLLHFNARDVFHYLKLFLTGKNPELKEQAIKLSGIYRIKQAVPYLIKILKKRDILETDMHFKLAAVKALGQIGDPQALDTLLSLYRSPKLLLHKGTFEEFKTEIVRSLEHYPFQQTVPILELAKTSKNKKEKALAQKLFSRKTNGQR
jgi:hypothetical protein